MTGKISEDPTGAAISGADFFAGVQGGANVKFLASQIGDYIRSLGFVRVLSAQSGGDTNNSSSGSGSMHAHSLGYTVPANTLTANSTLRVTVQYRINTGAVPPNLAHQMTLGGTIVVLTAESAPTASIVNDAITFVYEVQAKAAPGASAACETGILGAGDACANGGQTRNLFGAVINLATNGALDLAVATQWSVVGTGTNTVELTRLVVELVPG